jgi:AcrR family transcriptional regulator
VPDRETEGPTGTAQSKQRLAERIGAAIVAEVGSVGFGRASEERIIARAGVSREQFGSLYADKTECAIEAFEAMLPEFMERVIAAFAEGGDWRERLRRTAYASYDYFQEDPARARFTTIEIRKAGAHATALADQNLDLLVELVHAGRLELEDPGSVPRSVAEAAVGSIWSVLVKKIRADELADKTAVPQLMYIAILPYLGEAAAREELALPRPSGGRERPSAARRKQAAGGVLRSPI